MRHHLRPARNHQIFHPRHDLPRGQIGRGQPAAAETVERDAGRAHIIIGVERGHPPHIAALQSHLRAGAPDDVVYICGIDAIAVVDRAQHGRGDMLRVQMRQRALAQFADAARRADRVDDIGLCQGSSPVYCWLCYRMEGAHSQSHGRLIRRAGACRVDGRTARCPRWVGIKKRRRQDGEWRA